MKKLKFLGEHLKETLDRLNGFVTGTLVVETDKQQVSLAIESDGETLDLVLSDSVQIEVRNGDEYEAITIKQALETMDSETGWPLFAGLYARVKKK
ncbi:hypothetical protein [Bacillus sp. Hm123]|uniref:hypothetical protein n=1 Tax=Bacillus sp. Hm123 TaxID=3450745 RepID=UPI003F440323